jgi:hypothetical protein
MLHAGAAGSDDNLCRNLETSIPRATVLSRGPLELLIVDGGVARYPAAAARTAGLDAPLEQGGDTSRCDEARHHPPQ